MRGELPPSFKLLLESTGALAALLYAVGWVFAWAAYKPLELAPERAGVEPTFLLVRVSVLALVIVLFGGVLMLLFGLHRWIEHGRRGRLGHFHFVLVSSRVVLFAAILVSLRLMDTGPRTIFGIVAAVIPACIVVAIDTILVLRAVGYCNYHPDGPGLGESITTSFAVASALLWTAALIIVGYSAGEQAGRHLATGEELDLGIVRSERVMIVESDNLAIPRKSTGHAKAALPPHFQTCGLLMGVVSDSPTVYLPDEKVLIEISLENFAVVHFTGPSECG